MIDDELNESTAVDDSTEDEPVQEEEEVAEEEVEETEAEAPEEGVGAGPRLIVKRNGAETDISFPVNPPAILGRFDPSVGPIDVDLNDLEEGAYVSRKHAKITFEDDTWKLLDLGSSNGTFVLRDDFERIQETELQDGDEIALGNARFVFRLS